MADLHDVETGLVTTIASILYPAGTSQPSIITAPARVYAGWPKPKGLDVDIAAGTVNVSVFAVPNASKNTSRFQRQWQPLTIPAATLTIAVAGNQILLGGATTIAHVIAAQVAGKTYATGVSAGATLAAAAATLATLINADIPATSSGSTITVSTTLSVNAGLGIAGTAIREVRRQEQRFQVTIWAGTPALRSAAVQAIDVALADTPRLTMADGSGARLVYFGTSVMDTAERADVYRQDLFFTVEYATTQIEAEQQIVTLQLNTQDQAVFNMTRTTPAAPASIFAEVAAAPVAGVLAIDLSKGTTFDVLMNANVTSIVFLNRPAAGLVQRVELICVQDATGTRLIPNTAWPTGTQSPGGVAPVLSTIPGAQDRIVVEVGATSTAATLVGKIFSAIN